MSSLTKKGPPKGTRGTSNMSSSGIKSKGGIKSSGIKSSAGGHQGSRKSGMSASQVDGKVHSLIVRDPDNPQLDVTPLSLLEVSEPAVMVDTSGQGSLSPHSPGGESSALQSVSKSGPGSGWGSSGASTPTRMEEGEGLDGEAELTSDNNKRASMPHVTMLQDEFPTKPAEIQREKEREITVILGETQTFMLFDIPSSCIADDDENLKRVQAENADYTDFVKAKAGQDKYSDRAMQTLNTMSKNKDAQATPAPTASIGVDATNYEIHDAIEALKAGEAVVEDDMVGSSNKSAGEGKSLAALTGAANGSDAAAAIFELPKFKHAIMAAERVVVQNIYHKQQLLYRQAPPPEDGEEGKTRVPKLDVLFTFKCGLTEGRTVTCMSWNKLNPDLLAVGYGEFEFSQQRDGLVLFWSLKNPEYPHQIYKTSCSVTALNFANKSPNLLAVGLYDGTVGVYDVRKPDDRCVLESAYTSGKHTDAVWEVVWVDKGSERAEALVSVSADGRVTQWSMSKGLENSDLIRLKRVAQNKKPPAQGVGAGGPGGGPATNAKKESFISRMASGMCADFNSKDPSFYIVGTEEGSVHKCSVSYNEQYLESYFGHSGPVYKVAWSPYLSSAFMSCSADWAIKIWHQDSSTPMLTLQSSSDSASDIHWSPKVSTMFASVSGDGLVNIWDLSVSTLDPIVSEKRLHPETGERLVPWCIRYSLDANVVVVGDSSGLVTAYKLSGVDTNEYSAKEQVERLEKALASKDSAEDVR